MTAEDSAPVLVIKLGALGDIVQAMGPMAAIRLHHPNAAITVLTTAPFAELIEASPYVDDVWIDDKPSLTQPGKIAALRRRLRGPGFSRVYDLQTSDRSSFYYRLFLPGPMPEWSGIALGCSHPHANPKRDTLHTLDRQADQLAMAGIRDLPAPNLTWARADLSHLGLPAKYALLVPGSAPHRPEKRWPAERFAALATHLAAAGITPLLVGAGGEAGLHGEILADAPGAMSLAGKTSLLELACLTRSAVCAVGNDTGPMHIAAAAGCRAVSLFSPASDPLLCGPRGNNVTILFDQEMTNISVTDVIGALNL